MSISLEKTYTSEDIDDAALEICVPLIELYCGKAFDDTSDEEALEVLTLVRQAAIRRYSDLDFSQEVYSASEYHDLVSRIQEVVQILMDYYNLKKYSSRKLNILEPKYFKKISDPDFVFLNANEHYILYGENENKYHVKTALQNLSYLRGSILTEVFIYKIFEYLGFGPTADACFVSENKTLYTITHDLNNKGNNEESASFRTADDELLDIKGRSKKWKRDLFTFNLLVDFFELQDVSEKRSNYGVRKSERKSKEGKYSQVKIREKPVIVDFHVMKCGLNLNSKQVLRKYLLSEPQSEEFLFELNPSEFHKEDLEKIFKKLNRRTLQSKKLSLDKSIIAALEFTQQVYKDIMDSVKQEEMKGNVKNAAMIRNRYSIEPVISLKNHYLTKWKEFSSDLAALRNAVRTIEKCQHTIIPKSQAMKVC